MKPGMFRKWSDFFLFLAVLLGLNLTLSVVVVVVYWAVTGQMWTGPVW